MQEKQSIHSPYSEGYLLRKVFQEDRALVRLITYAGIRDERIRKVTQYNLLLAGQPPLPKLEILMAFSTQNLTLLQQHLQIREDVKTLGLKAVKKISERRVVDMQIAVEDAVAITLRNGVAFRGICKAFSTYNMIIEIRGELLLIYKHGIHAFEKNPY